MTQPRTGLRVNNRAFDHLLLSTRGRETGKRCS